MRRSFKAFNYAVKWTATASMESPLGSASDSDELSQAWPLAVAVVCFQNLVSGFLSSIARKDEEEEEDSS